MGDDQIEIRRRSGDVLYAIVDAADAKLLRQHKWHVFTAPRSKTYYARTSINGNMISMHILLLGKRAGYEIDHEDGNGLNNTRRNLRFVTHSVNMKLSSDRIKRLAAAEDFDRYADLL